MRYTIQSHLLASKYAYAMTVHFIRMKVIHKHIRIVAFLGRAWIMRIEKSKVAQVVNKSLEFSSSSSL